MSSLSHVTGTNIDPSQSPALYNYIGLLLLKLYMYYTDTITRIHNRRESSSNMIKVKESLWKKLLFNTRQCCRFIGKKVAFTVSTQYNVMYTPCSARRASISQHTLDEWVILTYQYMYTTAGNIWVASKPGDNDIMVILLNKNNQAINIVKKVVLFDAAMCRQWSELRRAFPFYFRQKPCVNLTNEPLNSDE